MNEQKIKEEQREFYLKHKAGCSFAAFAAKSLDKYGWKQLISSSLKEEILQNLTSEIDNPKTTTLSLIFPEVIKVIDLLGLIEELNKVSLVFMERKEFERYICYGIRVCINGLTSWVSGFGNFDFFPKTRQAPYTEIAIRVKPRPNYDWVIKAAPENVVHLADMDMKGLNEREFKTLWQSSLDNTLKILGHKPNLLSAAKTTFAIPEKYLL